ncbi:hypothetical protein CIG75_17630 [Tumebacillus algifaecis]|uniref:Uncharacterized protein n=1 Tax=Tumebacillus algifaecis TaxID=1214604 RepID=A0A223D5B4_9BACL|nr:hypothetical protein [Tumebacillus algifaecis]ASS76606.1 hypothetical protein CIG75_17630 [Tumebacillus algifaecis]
MTDQLVTIDRALYRLLHQRTYREAFLAGRYAELGWSEQVAQAFETVDRDELTATAKQISRRLLAGDRTSSKGLRGAFGRVFQALEAAGRPALDVVDAFVESQQYEAYREVPYAGTGICVEEAFYEFLKRDQWFVRDEWLMCLLTHEFLTALLGILTVNQAPAFVVRTELLQQNAVARFALQRYPRQVADALAGRALQGDDEVIWLYAATTAHFLSGPVSPLVAELLSRTEGAVEAGAEEQVRTTVQKLQKMGLLSGASKA